VLQRGQDPRDICGRHYFLEFKEILEHAIDIRHDLTSS